MSIPGDLSSAQPLAPLLDGGRVQNLEVVLGHKMGLVSWKAPETGLVTYLILFSCPFTIKEPCIFLKKHKLLLQSFPKCAPRSSATHLLLLVSLHI